MKTFPIPKNLFKASGKSTKVFSCLKVPLTSKCIDWFTSYGNIAPDPINFPYPYWPLYPLKKPASAKEFR